MNLKNNFFLDQKEYLLPLHIGVSKPKTTGYVRRFSAN
jgi:hypothetical protein